MNELASSMIQIITCICAILGIVLTASSPFLKAWIDKVGIDSAVNRAIHVVPQIVFYLSFLWLLGFSSFRIVKYIYEPGKALLFIDFVCFSAVICDIFCMMLFYLLGEDIKTIGIIKELAILIAPPKNEKILNSSQEETNKFKEKP